MTEAWIIDACRTPRGIGKAGRGALANIHAQRLGATVLKALAERNALDTAAVNDIFWGCGIPLGTQHGDLGRMSALDAGYDIRSCAISLDRFCGSGLSAVNLAAANIMSGMEDVTIGGGCESMSAVVPLLQNDVHPVMDRGNLHLREIHPQPHQGVAADAIAAIEGIAREDLDKLGVASQKRAAWAAQGGYFDKSLTPVHHDDGTLALDRDELPRPGTTLEGLAQLTPAFAEMADNPQDETGVTFRQLVLRKYPDVDIEPLHHPGTSSGVVDGAAALLLASPNYAKGHGLKPRARVVAMATAGGCPTLILDAPVDGAKKVLAKAGLGVQDIDLWEVNEAFAVVAEKFIRHLDLDRDTVNVNGGAIALGHLIGATGAILIGTALDELERRDLRRALVTMCTGGGMAPAIIIERV